MIKNLKCLQWNSRGLTKARLEEFRNLLNTEDPDLVFLSETYWKPRFTVKFKTYEIFKLDRSTIRGGGVALLVKKSLQAHAIPSPVTGTLEVIGAQVPTKTGPVNCFSVYSPRGDCTAEEINLLLPPQLPFIVAGDFNAHHSLWESNSTENLAGKSIFAAITDHPDATIITPKDLGTRIKPSSGKSSTIDLFISSSCLALNASTSLCPFSGSDHLPIITTLNADPIRSASKSPSWILPRAKWPSWNADLTHHLAATSFKDQTVPNQIFDSFMYAITAANEKNFKKTTQSLHPPKEPRHPWWNQECESAVEKVKQAEREWRRSPLSSDKRSAWKKADAAKKRLIISTKRNTWKLFISNLNPQDGQRTAWSFMKAMMGRGNNCIAAIPPLKNLQDALTTSTDEQANIFLDLFGSSIDYREDDATLDPIIASRIADRQPNDLNNAFTINELEQSLKKTQKQSNRPRSNPQRHAFQSLAHQQT
jgi:hypothetical protein